MTGVRDLEVPVDGERLHVRVHPAEKPRGSLLLVHGFLSEGREFGEAPASLAGLGWTVVVPDLRGHGRSTGPRGMASERLALGDARAVLDAAKREGLPGPWGIVGHSAGGALAARFLARFPDLAAGVLVAPLDRLQNQMSSAEFAGYRLARHLSLAKEAVGFGSLKVPYKYATRRGLRKLYDDPAAAARAYADKVLQTEADLAWYEDMIALDGEAWAREVGQPTMVVVCENDRIVRHASSERVHAALRGEKKLARIRSGHSAFGDRSAGELVRLIDEWFAAKLGSKA